MQNEATTTCVGLFLLFFVEICWILRICFGFLLVFARLLWVFDGFREIFAFFYCFREIFAGFCGNLCDVAVCENGPPGLEGVDFQAKKSQIQPQPFFSIDFLSDRPSVQDSLSRGRQKS